MIVVAYPGAWEEALGICFMHAADKPIRAVYLVSAALDERTESEAILLCPTVPFSVAEEIPVTFKDQCSNCGSAVHRIVRRDDLGATLRKSLNDHFKVAIHVAEVVSLREETDYIVLKENGNKIKADRAIVVATGATWDWKSIANVPLQVQLESDGRQVSHWHAEPLVDDGDRLDFAPLGSVSSNGEIQVEWALAGHNRYALRVTSATDVRRSELSAILQSHGWPRMRLRSCSRSHQFSFSLARFTRVAVFSFLKKWVIMYLQTWLRVATAVFLAARTRFLTSYVVFYSLELLVTWFIVKVHAKGLYQTTLSVLWLFIRAFERSEARVRSSTQSRFFSFTILLTLVQILITEAVKFAWRRTERWWRGWRATGVPLIKCRAKGQSNRVDLVLLDNDSSYSDVAFSRLILSYWGSHKELLSEG